MKVKMKISKKILSTLLCIAMMLSNMPATAYAEEVAVVTNETDAQNETSPAEEAQETDAEEQETDEVEPDTVVASSSYGATESDNVTGANAEEVAAVIIETDAQNETASQENGEQSEESTPAPAEETQEAAEEAQENDEEAQENDEEAQETDEKEQETDKVEQDTVVASSSYGAIESDNVTGAYVEAVAVAAVINEADAQDVTVSQENSEQSEESNPSPAEEEQRGDEEAQVVAEEEPNTLTADNVTMNKTAYDYTGDAFNFDLTVKDYNDNELVKGTDYTVVAYDFDLNTKTGTITVEGCGVYSGTVIKEFTIANIYAGQCGESAYWKFDPDTGTLTIYGSGAMYDYEYYNKTPWEQLKDEEILAGVVEEGITHLGDQSFYGANSMRTVSLPSSLRTFGYATFMSCIDLQGVMLPEGLEIINGDAFASCFNKNFTSITIPDSVTKLGYKAFSNCSELTSVTLSKNLTALEAYVFSGCSKLTNIIVPDSVTMLGGSAFSHCTNLTSVTLSKNLTSLGEYVFTNCTNLTAVTLPASVTSIAQEAFRYSGITALYMTGDAPTVDPNAFKNVKEGFTVYVSGMGASGYEGGAWDEVNVVYLDQIKVVDIEIGSAQDYTGDDEPMPAVTSINVTNYLGETLTKDTDYTITYNNDLEKGTGTVIIAGTGAYGGTFTVDYTFNVYGGKCGEKAYWNFAPDTGLLTISGSGAMYDYESEMDMPWSAYRQYEIKKVVVGKGITHIGNNAFTTCYSLEEVNLPESLTSIGKYAFGLCWSLKQIDLPEKLESIDEFAFSSCREITSIIIPDSVTSIGYSAFAHCTSLGNVTLSKNLTELSENLFSNCAALKEVTIPESVTVLRSKVFYKCTALTEVTIPSAVYMIYGSVFDGSGVIKVNMTGDAPFYVMSNMFDGTKEGLAVFVSGTNVDTTTYDTEPWTNVDVIFVDLITYAELGAVPDYTGNAEPKPAVTVTNHKNEPLTEGTDYTLTYNNDLVNGTGTVTITGTGKYGGTIIKEYTFNVYAGQCGDEAYWAFDPESGRLTITGTGAIWDSVVGEGGTIKNIWHHLRLYVKSVIVGEGITHLGEFAFAQNVNMTEVTLPETLTSIGGNAFSSCSKLQEIKLPSKVETIGNFAFSETAITSINIPNTVTTIGFRAFLRCTELKEITIPASVNDMSNYVFDGSGVTKVFMTGNAPFVGQEIFSGAQAGLVVYVSGTDVDTTTYAAAPWKDVEVVFVDLITSVEGVEDKAYTGSEMTQNLVVTNYKGEVLEEGVDYNVAYENHLNASSDENGPATVTITGIGAYGGTIEKEFSIAKKDITITVLDQAITYGETIEDEAYCVDGLLEGHKVTVMLTADTVNVTLGGTITAKAIIKAEDTVVTENYNISYSTGKLVINADLSALEGLTNENVTSADKDDIDEVLTMLQNADRTDVAEETLKQWDDAIAKCEELLDKIENTVAETNRIADAVEGYDESKVTSDDKAALEQLVKDIEAQLETENLTEDERKALEEAKDKAEGLLATIDEAAKAADTANTEKVKGVTSENVTLEDKTDLEKAKDDLEKALEDNAGNYTEDEKKAIEDEIKRIDDALEIIKNVEEVESLINKIPKNITKKDEAAIKEAEKAYNALSDYEKSLVDKNMKKALDDAKAALEKVKKPAETAESTSPSTGDNSNPWMWFALLFVSGAVIFGSTVYVRKRKSTSKG